MTFSISWPPTPRSVRPSALTTPADTVDWKPSGLPMAITSWPTRNAAESPSGGRGRQRRLDDELPGCRRVRERLAGGGLDQAFPPGRRRQDDPAGMPERRGLHVHRHVRLASQHTDDRSMHVGANDQRPRLLTIGPGAPGQRGKRETGDQDRRNDRFHHVEFTSAAWDAGGPRGDSLKRPSPKLHRRRNTAVTAPRDTEGRE